MSSEDDKTVDEQPPTIEEKCAALVDELAKHGVPASYERLNPMDLRTVGWLEAITQVLIEIGPATEERIKAHMWRNIHARLSELLVAVEAQEAANPKQKPSDIVLARSLPKRAQGSTLKRND